MTVLQRDTEKDVVLPWGPARGSEHDDLVIAEVRRGGLAGTSVGDVTHTRAGQLAWVTKDGQSYTYSTSAGTKRSSITNDPVTGQPLPLRAQGEGQALYIYDGAPGSPMSILGADADQEVELDYDPFGVPLTEDGASEPQNPYSFGAAGVKDRTTGWVRYGYRYYDPKTGTFTQQDTLDAPLDPLNGNRYAYAGNDPINKVDPTGLVTGLELYTYAQSCANGASFGFFAGSVAGSSFFGIGAGPGATIGSLYGCAAGFFVTGTTGEAIPGPFGP